MDNKKLKIAVFILFICITVLAFVIRIYKVDKAPSGILIDEASFGYNTYSILKTGKDEHGISFPLIFKAFGDQKLPAYAYTVVPFVKYLGLNNLAVRLPSVIAGSFLSGVMFLLFLEFGFSLPVSFIGGLITATSPWAIILSRFGYESNFGLLFFILGMLLSLQGYKKQNIFLAIIAGLCLSITLYSYVAFKFITPIILVVLVSVQKIIGKHKNLIGIVIFTSFIIFLFPIFTSLFSSQTTARYSQLDISRKTGAKMEVDEDRAFCGKILPKLLCYSVSNKLIVNSRTYMSRYVNALSPPYLFLEGDLQYLQINATHFGAYYLWLIFFYFLGFYQIIKKLYSHTYTVSDVLVICALLITPIPSVLVGEPQKVRISSFFPFLTIILVYGIALIENTLKKKYQKTIFMLVIVIFSLLSVGYFMIRYTAIQIQKNEITYGTYIPKLMRYLGKQDKDTQIYIQSIPEGIMYYAYVNAIDPIVYQKRVIRQAVDTIGFAHAKDLENIHITEGGRFDAACKAKQQGKRGLFVTSVNDATIPSLAKKIVYSENDVDSLAVVYDLEKIGFDYALCKKIQ